MKFLTNKKGGLPFEIIVVFALAAILIFAFGSLTKKYEGFHKKIGEKQFELFSIYQEGENLLFYVDSATRLSLHQALFDVGKHGGLAQPSCGSYYGYALWEIPTQDCTPTNQELEIHVKKAFSSHLDSHLSVLNIPLNNYDSLEISQNLMLSGKASAPIELPILTRKEIASEKAYEKQDAQQELTLNPPSSALKTRGMVPIKDVYCEGTCVLDSEAYQKLVDANTLAKQRGFEIRVTSGYRSLEQQRVQWELWGKRIPDIKLRQTYVCNPAGADAHLRCPHLTGKAVDLTIKGKTQSQMTPSDWKKLEDVMYRAGWIRYASEAWHFEYETSRWQRAKAEEKSTGKEVRAIV